MLYNTNSQRKFINRPPNWIIRKGNLVIFTILSTTFVLSFIIRYNDTLSSEILLTSKNPPVHIVSKKGSRVSMVNVVAGEKIVANQVLAVLENNSDSKDVYNLKKNLTDSSLVISNMEDLLLNYPSNLKLESAIQISYQNFISKYSKYILNFVLRGNKYEFENIESRLKTTKSLVRNKQLQLDALNERLKISKKSYNRQKILFKKGVISQQQLDGFLSNYLNSKAEYQNFKQELDQLYVDSLTLKNQGVKTNNLDIINATIYSSELQLAKQELIAKITEWEDINILKSPIDGYITIFDIWNKNQMVKKGEKVLTVIPSSKKEFIGICKVPIKNSGKIIKGQKVIIKIDNYPSHEWGNLNGIVSSISEVPKKGRDSYYSVYIKIPSLKTSYDKKIDFKQELFGTANIVLEETSLLARVFYELREIWSEART